MKKAVLAFTDGYSLYQSVYPNYEEAKKAMDSQYNDYYDEEKDIDGDSYLDGYEARVVRTCEDIWFWNIIEVEV